MRELDIAAELAELAPNLEGLFVVAFKKGGGAILRQTELTASQAGVVVLLAIQRGQLVLAANSRAESALVRPPGVLD